MGFSPFIVFTNVHFLKHAAAIAERVPSVPKVQTCTQLSSPLSLRIASNIFFLFDGVRSISISFKYPRFPDIY